MRGLVQMLWPRIQTCPKRLFYRLASSTVWRSLAQNAWHARGRNPARLSLKHHWLVMTFFGAAAAGLLAAQQQSTTSCSCTASSVEPNEGAEAVTASTDKNARDKGVDVVTVGGGELRDLVSRNPVLVYVFSKDCHLCKVCSVAIAHFLSTIHLMLICGCSCSPLRRALPVFSKSSVLW